MSTAETLALRIGAAAIGLGINVIISRALGPEGRGQYTLAILGALVLATLGKLGMEHANVYLFGTLRVPRDRLVAQNAVVSLLAGVPATFILLLGPDLLPTLFADMPTAYLVLAGITIPFAIHSQLAGGLQNLTGLVTWQFRALLAGQLAQLAVAGILIVLGHLDVTSALVTNAVGTLFAWVLIVYRDGLATLRLHLDMALLSRSLRYSLIVHAALVLLLLETRLNLFLVKGLLDTAAVGQYSLAVSLAEAFVVASDSLAIVLVPQQTVGSLASAGRIGLTGARLGAVFTGMAAIPGIVVGPAVISAVFGEAFGPSYPPFAVLLVGMIFFAMQRYCGPPALRANDPFRMVRIFFVGVIVNLLLSVWWIPAFGLVGAAAATTASYAVTAILFVRWTYELSAGTQGSAKAP